MSAQPGSPRIGGGAVAMGRRGPLARALATRAGAAWVVGGLTLLALALRLACIHQSLFGDELFLYGDVHDHPLGEVFHVVRQTEKTPPLGFVLGWLFARGDNADTLMRVPSLVASVATVPLVYALGVRTVGRAAGMVAAAWFALSAFQILYGTDGRAYALVTALVVTSTLALLNALEARRIGWWALYVVAAGAAVYTHYIGALVLVPQAAWGLWAHREQWRAQLAVHALVVLAFLPYLPSFIDQARNSNGEARRIAEFSPFTVGHVAETWAQSYVGHPYVNLSVVPGRPAVIVIAAVLLGLVVALLTRTIRPDRERRPQHVELLALLALAAPVAIVLYDLRPHASFLLPRNLIVSVPYGLLLVGWLLTAGRARIALAASLVAVAAVGVGSVKMLDPDYQRTDARDAAHWVDEHGPPGAPLVDWPGPHGIRIYLDPRRPAFTIAQFGPAQWATAARSRTPVLMSFPDVGGLGKLLVPPPEARHRLVAEHTARGIPAPLTVREYAPR
jgi:hypothetical protein